MEFGKVTKAVFPVAGLGSRFLPVTKASPKEMLPIVDKPLIQFAVEEAAAAGITDMVFINGRNKRAIEDHFDKAYELETELAAAQQEASSWKSVQGRAAARHQLHLHPAGRGAGPGTRRALRRAGHRRGALRGAARRRPHRRQGAGDAADDRGRPPRALLGDRRDDGGGRPMSAATASSRREPLERRQGRIARIVEKPKPGTTPSTLGVVGRYILTPRIFDHLRAIAAGAGGEIQLTDGIARLLEDEKVLAYQFEGRRYDCGHKLGYLEAMVDYGLKHPETADGFARFIASKAR